MRDGVEMGKTLSLDSSTDGNTWNTTKYGNLITSRSEHACIEFDAKLYVIGGKNKSSHQQSVEILDLESGNWPIEWEEGPPLPPEVIGCQAVTYENVIYLIDQRGSVLRLDNDNKWMEHLTVETAAFAFLPATVIKAKDCLQGRRHFFRN